MSPCRVKMSPPRLLTIFAAVSLIHKFGNIIAAYLPKSKSAWCPICKSHFNLDLTFSGVWWSTVGEQSCQHSGTALTSSAPCLRQLQVPANYFGRHITKRSHYHVTHRRRSACLQMFCFVNICKITTRPVGALVSYGIVKCLIFTKPLHIWSSFTDFKPWNYAQIYGGGPFGNIERVPKWKSCSLQLIKQTFLWCKFYGFNTK